MRLLRASTLLAGVALVGALASTSPAAKPKPVRLTGAVRIAFSGAGQETFRQYKQWIYQADNRCGYDKTVENTAGFSWASTWDSVSLQALARGIAGRAARSSEASGHVAGTEVRTDCGYPLPLADWAGTGGCDEAVGFPEPATLDVAPGRAGSAVLDFQAPPLTLHVPTSCSLRPRNSQLTVSFRLSVTALQKLAKGKTLRIAVGTSAPSLVPYAREYDCSASEPPYEGVRIDDSCKDVVAWQGTVTLTRL